MAVFGANVNPSLGRQDFSGIMQGGQMMAQGTLAGGQGIARGIEAAGNSATDAIKQYQQNKLMAGLQISKFEAAFNADTDGSMQQALQSSPEAAKLVQKMAKSGNLNLKDASQLGAFVDTFQLAKQRDEAAKMQQSQLKVQQQAADADTVRAKAAMLNAQKEKEGPPGTVMTKVQLAELAKAGSDYKAVPMQDGNYYVTSVSAFAPKSDTVVNIGDKTNQGAIFTQVANNFEAATKAQSAMSAMGEAKAILDSGNVFTGAGAEEKLALAKLGSLFGIGDGSAVENTETLRSQIGVQVASYVKNFGAGNGITEKDVEFSKEIVGGKITLDDKSIRRLINIGYKASKAQVDRHEQVLNDVYPEADPNSRQARALFKLRPMAKDDTSTVAPGSVLVYDPATGTLKPR
jgi:hypothetical protein